jgi:hypothetical protein
MKNPPSDLPPTMDLSAIQHAFGNAVMRPLDETQGMQRVWVNGEPALEMASSFIKPNARLDSIERLEIYNRQYWFRLINSFYEDFPALRTVLGEDRFYDLTIAYLTKNPSRSFTLRNLGDRLESFLEEEPHWVAPHKKLARDIVRLEWAHIVAFDGGQRPPLETDELLDSDPATLQVDLQPHITFLDCDYAVDDFVLAIRKQEVNPGEASNAVSEKFSSAPVHHLSLPKLEKNWLAVHRLDNSVYYKRIEYEAYLICTALREGIPLQAACEQALLCKAADETFSATLQSWFAQWASFGWLCRYSTETQ